MIVSRKFLFYVLLIAGFLFVTESCSPTASSRTSKYSSVNKRSKKTSSSRSLTTYASKTRTTTKKTVEAPKTASAGTGLRSKIVSSAISFSGIKYKYGGKSPATGFDCSGFTNYVFNQNGISMSGPSHQLATLGPKIPAERLKPGDLVFFGDKNKISHVAIVAEHSSTNKLEVVHATTSAGVRVDNISNSDYWQSRFLYGVDVLSR